MDSKQEQNRPEPEEAEEERTSGDVLPGVAQVGNKKVPRPDKVSDRSVPDDVDE
jgi:hypothetical protein